MARVYADLIRKGKINIENVPVKIRTEVEAIFKCLDFCSFYYLGRRWRQWQLFMRPSLLRAKKSYAQVPEKIKPQARQVLIDLECEDLIVEE